MDKFSRIRDNNLKEQNRRFAEVIEKYEDIARLIEEKKRLIGSFDSAILQVDSFNKYTKDIKAINERIQSALDGHGLKPNYLEPIFNCSNCEDKGIVYKDGAVPVRCHRCNSETSSIGTNFADFSLNIFSKEKDKQTDKYSPYEKMQSNLTITKDYCDNFPNNPKKNLLFYGGSGLGKSFLASCMCSELSSKGFAAVKVNAFTLIEDFKNKHVEGLPYPKDYYGCDFLVIDDIGTEPMYNNITVEYLFSLINERLEKGRATLYITNQSYSDCVSRYDERLASRIFDEIATIRMAFIGKNRRMGM